MTAKTKKPVDVKTEEASEFGAFSALAEAQETASEKFEEGSEHAQQSAKEAAQATGKAFAWGTYSTAYWISYGLVYSAVYLTGLFPEGSSFRRGLEEGAADATAKAHHKKKTDEAEPEEEAAGATQGEASATT